MKYIIIIFISTLLLSCQNEIKEKADYIYINGKIYTVNESQPWAEAIAIKDGKFIKVGATTDVNALIGDNTKVVDLKGQFVMPGITDMHAHPFTGVDLGTGSMNLTNPGDREAILADIRKYVNENPDKDVYLGGNWNVGGLFENDSPDKKILDEIIPDKPVFILSQSGHSAWVNSKALEISGVDENFQNEGSYIFDRYPGTNEPSGTVRESGMVTIMNNLNYLNPNEFAPLFKNELVRYSKYGITNIQPAEGAASHLLGAALLEKNDELNVRLFPALDWLTSQLRVTNDEDTKAFIDDWKAYETELIKPHYVKIFADGAADSHTLLLSEPYADAPDTKGSMYLPIEDYSKAILDYHSKDISVHIHAMGDQTSTLIIDIFEEAEATYPDSKGVLHFGHAPFVKEADLDRLSKLKKVTMNFSPMLAVPHPQMKLFVETPLGKERHQKQYPVKTSIEKGLIAGFGSDFPSSLVPEPNSFYYMQGWVTREVPGQSELGTINISNAITIEQAIKGFTLGGAQALGYNYANDFGSIEIGKSADFVILDQNLLEIDKRDIYNTNVMQTIFRGKVVYSNN
ncbi:amidohydrolase [Algibacter mikhailovii]|uniref:Amidohydrolase n=1 Tax=Algibacter mikhailovii TaxID=425498 RepID=A0A918RC72_9FLAO|nr:amidohydrolase [Algibacter mikhailovii]GGZ90009.1 putative amidohydrolase [Algibacter mikhailovii]